MGGGQAIDRGVSFKSLAVPSLADILLIALLGWMLAFTISAGNTGLLFDSTVGLHVRYGDLQRAEGHVPAGEPWSYTDPDGPMVRWEWLAENWYSRLHEQFGLRGLIVLAAGLILASLGLAVRRVMNAGAGALVGIVILHMGISISSVHFLARPLAFTFFLLNVSLWILEKDRLESSWRVWLLLPITAVWANLHGGYLGLVITLGAISTGSAVEFLLHRTPAARTSALRYGLLAAACIAASFCNPYGPRMLATELDYLRADWPRTIIQEYQRPNFTSATGIYLLALFALGLLAAIRLVRRREYGNVLLIAGWGYAAATSIRHAPIFFFVTAPFLAAEAQCWWERAMTAAPPKSLLAILRDLSQEHQPSLSRNSAWPAVLLVFLLFSGPLLPWPDDLPASQNPVEMAHKHRDRLMAGRAFTTDVWTSYLIYHEAPGFRYFLGEFVNAYHRDVTDQYLKLMQGEPDWQQVLDRYQVSTLLIPPDCGLAQRVRTSKGWKIVDEDSTALVAARASAIESSALMSTRGGEPEPAILEQTR